MPGWLKYVGLFIGVSVIGIGAGLWMLSEERPTGKAGPEADALARALERSTYPRGWREMVAIKWTFDGRNRHLWDRERQLISVQFEDFHVLRHLHTADGGRAYQGGKELLGEQREALLEKAYALWCNDSFWLNPLEKLFDEGARRELVGLPGGDQGLLVTYGQGGITPGDAYLWHVGPSGAPTAFKMWVSIIPFGGLSVTWEGWQTLATGARVSTVHRIGLLKTLALTDVVAARRLEKLAGGEDPFATMFR